MRGLGLLVVTSLLLSGCAGGKADAPAEPAQPASVASASGEPVDGGKITGVVTDDTLAPIPRAQVAILSLNLFVVTNEAGEFGFENLAPGTYQVAAAALGFSSAAKSVDVVALETTPVSFTLTAVELAGVPYVLMFGPYKGFANCVFGTPVLAGVCPGASAFDNEKSSFTQRNGELNHTANVTASIVGELRWQQASAGTSRLLGLTLSYQGRPNTHWWCWGSGVSPVKFEYVFDGNDCITTGGSTQQGTGGDPPEPDQELVSFVSIPFTSPGVEDPFPAHVALQQSFEVVYSVFQYERPADAYTAFPDA